MSGMTDARLAELRDQAQSDLETDGELDQLHDAVAEIDRLRSTITSLQSRLAEWEDTVPRCEVIDCENAATTARFCAFERFSDACDAHRTSEHIDLPYAALLRKDGK